MKQAVLGCQLTSEECIAEAGVRFLDGEVGDGKGDEVGGHGHGFLVNVPLVVRHGFTGTWRHVKC